MRCAVSFLTIIALTSAVGLMALLIIWFTEGEGMCGMGSDARTRIRRCLPNGRCLKPSDICNNFTDCPDGTDESPMLCNDFSSLDIFLDVMSPSAKNDEEKELEQKLKANVIKDKPEICQFLQVSMPAPPVGNWTLAGVNSTNSGNSDYLGNNNTDLEVYGGNFTDMNFTEPEVKIRKYKVTGVKCHGLNMTEIMTAIPWQQIDKHSRVISIDSGALNTTLLTGPPANLSADLEFPLLTKVYLDFNYIESVAANAFCHLKKIEWFSMSSSSVVNLSADAFCSTEKLRLIWLKLSDNHLHLRGFYFKNMPQLEMIDLDQNDIEEITNLTFSELYNLKILNISHNRITTIHQLAFSNNPLLSDLDLSSNRLHELSPDLLLSQSSLTKLYITDNPKVKLPKALFRNLTKLESLNVDTLEIPKQLDPSSFKSTIALDLVYFKKFSYCKYIPTAHRCYPYTDGVSSNVNLLIGHNSRVMVWLVGLATILGNLSVLANRWGLTKKPGGRTEITKIINIFVSNLAISDLLMGVYLFVLAWKDAQFRGMYSVKAYEWGSSYLCSAIGICALISSEVSLLILTIMSLERYLTIGGPFSDEQSLNAKLARVSMLIIWGFVSILAVAPAIAWQSSGNVPFYGSTGLCMPLHLDEQFPTGWQYTAFVFVGVNSGCLVVITASYTALFFTVRTTQGKTPLQMKNIELASRFFLMVFTDVLCWAPIILMKIAVLMGDEVKDETIAWVVIYILPLNSAVNPILYTFSTVEVRAAIVSYFRRMRDNLEGGRGRRGPAMNSMNPANSLELRCITRYTGTTIKMKEPYHPEKAPGTEETELTQSAVVSGGREGRSSLSS